MASQTINVKGIILREAQYGENDKMLTVLTHERGKISVHAHGVMKYGSSNFSFCQMFSYSNFSLYEKSGVFHLKEGSLIESFYDLRKSLDGSALAYYIAETAVDCSKEDLPEESILRLVLNSLYCICNSLYPIWQIKGVYEFRLCNEIGFTPKTALCENCGKPIEGNAVFNITNGYIRCKECHTKARDKWDIPISRELEGIYSNYTSIIEISYPVTKALGYISSSDIKRIFSFKLDDSESVLFSNVCEKYFLTHIDRTFPSLDFYKKIHIT